MRKSNLKSSPSGYIIQQDFPENHVVMKGDYKVSIIKQNTIPNEQTLKLKNSKNNLKHLIATRIKIITI